jgi:hypothetical protein
MKIRVTLTVRDDARRGIWCRLPERDRRGRTATREQVLSELYALWDAHQNDLASESDENEK